MNKRHLPTIHILIKTSESQPETTTPAKPRKSCLFFVKGEQKKE
jgi:hypothetical protein